ncbi:hypothetical protein ACQHIV_39210 [Kribbella sp. GL6]|uniref:hypothetical protein n=1 Tax=Kribbella sp. GL6 TaxID=3419765 RepID=UPI003D08839E
MVVDNREPQDRPPVFLFLDESGTAPSDPLTMVGATAFHDIDKAEAAIIEAHGRALGDASLWRSSARRRKFSEVGFHFTEDSESVRSAFLSALDSIDYRAYAAYAKNDEQRSTTDLIVAMYGTLLSSVLARYQEYTLTVVFEQNSTMDSLYGKIWSVLQDTIRGIESATALRGTKSAPCLAATDYVLGVTRAHLLEGASDFQERRFVALGRSYAYLIDFDDDRHLGGRKHPIL